jgi:hypothetical protein
MVNGENAGVGDELATDVDMRAALLALGSV